MNRHATTEQLSAYLDRELGAVELRQLEAHCAVCEECQTALASMRRVVHGLDRVGRAVPPAALRQQIRRQVIVEASAPAYGFRAVLERFRVHLLALQPELRTASVMGLALVFALLAVYPSSRPQPVAANPVPQEIVTVTPYSDSPVTQTTTAEVAGREFIWTETKGWIQKGLEGKTPEAHFEAGGPQGRALLNRYSGLALLLTEGPVVFRYDLGTVELRQNPPTRDEADL
ncbi:MAG TPA: zf-HC2 domain-containing protein, partial [Thermoanaerobaculia bacterium]|nr:zf-HC2 domain-containing protein [Thermoanaerobaculia bacterium]